MSQAINFKDHGSIQALNTAFGSCWMYVGRENRRYKLPQSPLANQFKAKDFGGRGKTLPHYKRWLWEQIKADNKDVLNALTYIVKHPDIALVCWCKPGPCHIDIIQAAATWLQEHAVFTNEDGADLVAKITY